MQGIAVTTMPLNKEDREELTAYFDDRYVRQNDCNDKQRAVNDRFANDDKRIDKLADRLAIWNKLLWAIATSSIGALVVSFLELIIK